MSVINTNISSMQAQSSVRTSGLNLSTAMERLSSGIRINSAKDDAAGLAISTRMTASIRGISAAIRNANDGISLTQTAEGSLNQISDNLQRIRELAVQAANTGNNASDRAAMNNEATQLIAEIDRVASNTTYNGIALLDGSFQSQNLQVGAGNGSNDRIAISIDSAKSSALGVGATSSYETTLYGAEVGTAALEDGALAINGYTVGAAVADGVSYTGDDSSAIAVAAAINAISGSSGVYASAAATNTTITLAGTASTAFTAIAAGDVKINGVSIGAIASTTTTTLRGAAMATAINAIKGDTGVTAVATAGVVALTSTSGKLVIETGTTGTSTLTGLASTVLANSTLTTYGGTAVTGHATAIAAGGVTINGVDIGAIAAAGSAAERGGQVSAAINAVSDQTGVTAGFDTSSGKVFLTAADGRNVTVTTTTAATAVITGLASGGATTDTTRSVVTLTSASEDGITISDIGGASATASGLTVGFTDSTETAGAGVSSLDLTTATGAQDALTTLDSAINTITDSRAAMGAYQNRLTASIANLETTSMNLSASRSRILDTDYAKETTNLAKSQIIQQAATAMLDAWLARLIVCWWMLLAVAWALYAAIRI
jgi:flagellin